MSEKLKPYVRRNDESGHTYFIPEDERQEFDELSAKIDRVAEYEDEWYDLIDVFESRYARFRLGGSDHDIVFYINPDNLK